MTLENVVNGIKSQHKADGPLLIAIEGFGGSGKTTIANRLRAGLGSAYVINIDDFIVKEKVNEPSWDKGGFDRKRLEEQVLAPASQHLPIKYQRLLWESNMLSKPMDVPDVSYLIVEGISSYHPDIAHYYDCKIWVDTPLSIAKSRGQARDLGNENYDKWDAWASNDLEYQQKYHSERRADFVVSNQ